MAMLAVANIGGALQQWYLEGLRTQINEETDPLYSELEKTTDNVAGSEIVLSLRYGRSGGVGSRADDGDLPTPNARKSVQAKFQTKNSFGRMQLTEKAIKVSERDRGAFVNILEQTLNDLLTDAKDNVQRQMYGDGTGKIATLAANAAAVTTITLDTVVGLAEGMLIDVLRGDTKAVLHNGFEIIGVDDDNNQITVSAAVTADAARLDFVTVNGSYNLEMTGIGAIFTPNTTLYGLDRSQAAYKFLNPTTIAVNGEISEVKIQEGLDKANNRTGVRHDFLIGSKGVRRAWQNLKEASKSTVNTIQLKGGWEAPTYQNGEGSVLPFIGAKYAPTGRLRAISRKNFQICWMADWDWMNRDGAVLSRVAGKNAYEATLELFSDICCDLPRGQVDFTGITEH